MSDLEGSGARDLGDYEDLRVRAVLEVLSGDSPNLVAERWGVERVLLARWVQSFVEAGTAQVTNRPIGAIAQRRDRFLTTFMHGLRSSLALAQAWAGLLQDTPSDADGLEQITAHLQTSLDQLDERVLEVQLLTAAMLGRLVPEIRRVSLAELVSGLDPVPDVEGDGDAVEMNVDPDLFVRVLRDVRSAATEAGKAPDSVVVEVESVHPWIEVRVVRRGEPIEPSVLHAMFEPFDGDHADERVTVGLYLARALIVVHGGTIGVDQDDDTTTFAVRIPDGRPTGVAAVPIQGDRS